MISKKQTEHVLRVLLDYSKNKHITENPSPPTKEAESNIVDSQNGICWGEKIKKERINAGLSQATLGNKIGRSQSAICLIEKGKVTEETARWILKIIKNWI